MNFIQDLEKAKYFQNQRLFQDALKIYKNIIAKDKNNFEANIGLAITYFLTNQVLESIKILKNLISIYPKKIESYYNYANILISQNKFDEAIEILLQAYKIDNKNIKILENITYLYLQSKNSSKAKKFAKLAIDIDNKNYFIYNIFGQIYFSENNIEKSVNNFKLSIQNNNLFWPAYDNLLTLYEQVNDLEQLNTILVQAKKLFGETTNLVRIKYFQALLFFRNNDFVSSLNLLEGIKDEIKNRNIKHQQYYYDLLGKNYDKLKKYNQAFNSFTIRNDKILNLETNQRFDKNILIDLIKVYENYFVKKNIQKYNFIKIKDEFIDPIFLIGFPRSGTTLLDTILRSHSKTIVLEEKPYISNIRDEFFKLNNNLISSLENINSNQINNIRQNYFNNIGVPNKSFSSNIIIDKLPLNIIEIGFIKRIFPNSKFILMMRHPCDCVLSCFITDFSINEAMIHFLNINDTVNFYSSVFKLWQHLKKNLDIKFHMVKYEELINDFDKTINYLLKFLEIEWEETLKDFNQTALKRQRINTPSYDQVIRPLNTDSIDRWKNYEEMHKIKNKLDEWIKHFNY
tara:strand:+ start:1507 stop:3222 length:1716 start_codon:yes stop_codon:yes gene_type:complete